MDRLILVVIFLSVLTLSSLNLSSTAKTTHKHSASGAHSVGNKHSVSNNHSAAGKHSIAGKQLASAHQGRHSRRHRHARRVIAHRYAYPMDLFLLQPPEFSAVALSEGLTHKLKEDFENGTAGVYPASALVQAGLVAYQPLHGGIFWRRQPVKYLIMHSTESVVPRDAPQIINGWNSLGRRHAGAQYVVDRDGHIYETVDPELATVHVNIFKTLPGINNDNSIGIEMVHAGHQQYTHDQLKSVVRLVAYLLQRYQIDPSNLITHRYAQQGDHTDPVAFDWDGFVSQVEKLHKRAIAKEMVAITQAGKEIAVAETPAPPKSTAHPPQIQHIGAAEANDGLHGAIEVEPSAASTLIQSK